jgi:gliding motility-associated-like protein
LIVNSVEGIGPYTYLWQYDNSRGLTLEGIPRGVYNISIQDSRGCISNGLGEMVEEEPQVRMPTGFNPLDGLYGPVSNCNVNFSLKVLNRWGNLIFSGDSGWDGLVNGQEAPIGSYTYLIFLEMNVNGQAETKEISGFFTLIR